jgi:hypothetical protein
VVAGSAGERFATALGARVLLPQVTVVRDLQEAAWVRAWEQARTAGGDQLWVCVAVANATGALVGFTEAQVAAAGDAQQHDTGAGQVTGASGVFTEALGCVSAGFHLSGPPAGRHWQ